MINFVTDIKEGEPDILGAVKSERLLILALDGSLITEVPAPLNGWTHGTLLDQAIRLKEKTTAGAEAFVGKCWVGSTEV